MKKYLPLFIFNTLLIFHSTAQLKLAGMDPSLRAVTHIERMELEGWKEIPSMRSEHYSEFITNDGRKIGFTSKAAVNYKSNNGKWNPIDIRCKKLDDNSFQSYNRPDKIVINSKGEVLISGLNGFNIGFGKLLNVNGVSRLNFSKVEFKNQTYILYKNIVTNVDRSYCVSANGVKSSVILNSAPSVLGSDFILREEIVLNSGSVIEAVKEESLKEGNSIQGNLFIRDGSYGQIQGKIYSAMCYDANGQAINGKYIILPQKNGKFILETRIPKSWLNDPSRLYPVTLDPLVTGPTTTWAGSYIPSCFFPAYNVDSINVTVPAGITVTKLWLTSSFWASPFTTTVMGDGRMFFSTPCGNTTIFSITGTPGLSPGTAYLDNYDVKTPLMCCYPQTCSSYSFWLAYHLSRTSNGAACSSVFLYYDPFGTSWPFSAYVEGYTPETFGFKMQFNPTTICATTCTIDAKIYARYGVPPFTFTHPWSTDTIVGGTPLGCGSGSNSQTLTLNIPGCPAYCDTTTVIYCPPPLVIDACGDTVIGFDSIYSFNVKPVANVVFDQDTIQFCSGSNFTANVSSCLPGATITWNGNGLSGTTLVQDTLYDTTNAMIQTMYTTSVDLNGCTGIGDTLIVQTWPYAEDSFSIQADPLIVNLPVAFTNSSNFNGNSTSGYLWAFGDSTFSSLTNPSHIYTDTGWYSVCLYMPTLLGCNDTSCKTLHIIDVELLLPNIMTPNGDGTNDNLFIRSLWYYPTNKITVYNRWGQIIFQKENYANDWNAPGVSDGAYWYFLEIPGFDVMRSVLEVVRNKK